MRIYQNPHEAYRETERDLWEMGQNSTSQSKQNTVGEFETKELVCYGFQVSNYTWSYSDEVNYIKYAFDHESPIIRDDYGVAVDIDRVVVMSVLGYIEAEFADRVGSVPVNPGSSWQYRADVWQPMLRDNGSFDYTYSERIFPQLQRVITELRDRPGTRQAIINLHSNICPRSPDYGTVEQSADLLNMGGHGRIPCSMFYQFFRRKNKLDMLYTMRSCDFLVHHPVDIMLALRLQKYVADMLSIPTNMFTYFSGSLHAFKTDMAKRGIF